MWFSTGIRRAAMVCALMAASFAAAPAAKAADDGLMVHDAWVQFVPGAKTLAGYFTIMNSGGARQLIAAECDSFEKTELHISRIHNGVATMEPVAQLSVPANGNVKFAPGGLHVMLIGPKAELAEGGKVDLRLVFSDGTKLPVSAVVKKGGDGGGHKH